MTARDLSLDQLGAGMEARFTQRIGDEDLNQFAGLSGDLNPLHTDREHARRAGYKDRVVHGAMLGALVSRLVGMELPGRRSLLLSMKLEFVAPSFPGDTVEVMGRIDSIHAADRVVVLKVSIRCGEEMRARGSVLVRVTE